MSMLRRRKKSPRIEKRPAELPAVARSRRRARAGAVVPPELIIDPARPAPRAASRELAPQAPMEAPQRKPRRAAVRDEPVVLVTGFEAFDGEPTNPSWEICNRLPRAIGALRVETCRVPCEFRHAIEVVAEAIERLRPAIVVSLGQAGGRAHLSVERVAINVDDARIADNAGERPIDEPIAANGPPAYFATLPVKAMAAAMRAAGVPTEVSNSAGTYVCNHLMYGVLHFLAASGIAARAGFIHVPYAEGQVLDKPGIPALSLATMVKGVEAAIAAAHGSAPDAQLAAGEVA
jgi:pyroglutamyl-peptidase